MGLRWRYNPNRNWACFVRYFKIINTFLKNNMMSLKQIFCKTPKWHENFNRLRQVLELKNKRWDIFFVLPIFDGVIKKSHLLCSFLELCYFCILSVRFIWQKYYIISLVSFNNCTPYENKCFDPRNQIHRVAFFTLVNSICIQMRHAIRVVHMLQICNYPE